MQPIEHANKGCNHDDRHRKKASRKDWRPAGIKAALHKRGITLSGIAKTCDQHRQPCHHARRVAGERMALKSGQL